MFGGEGPIRLAGKGAGALARAVDGTRDRSAVLAHASSEGLARDRAEAVLDKWMGSGHVTDSPAPEPPIPVVHVIGAAPDFVGALGFAGVTISDQDPSLTAVIVDDLLVGPAALKQVPGRTVLVQLYGDRALVSPVLGDGSPCATCLATRVAVRRGADLVAARRAGLETPPRPAILHPEAVTMAAALVASMARGHGANEPTVAVCDPLSGAVTRHRLVAVPGCAACDPGGTSLVGAHLDDSLPSDQQSVVDGAGMVGFRAVDPEETWLAHAHHISDVVGAVPVVELIGPPSFRVYAAGANLVGTDDPEIARSVLRNRGGGKGLTLGAARAGALAEALERDAMRFRGDEPRVTARMTELAGALDPTTIQLFSERQMSESEGAWMLTGSRSATGHPVPHRFEAEREREWSAVRSLTDGRIRWIPTSMMFTGYPRDVAGLPPACSNGAAAGNTYAEAILQGLLELVERDAVALWWYPRSRRRYFDLDAWDDARVHAAATPHRVPGVDLRVLDLTTDLGIPAAVAIVHGDAIPVPLLGAGAHTDPAIAVARAITEVAQMRAAFSDVDPSDPGLREWVERSWARDLLPSDSEWLFGTQVADIPESPHYSSVTEARDDVVSRIAARGHDVLWADLSRKDCDLRVVRTYAPGLRHFWRRLAPGRLYDVPLAQGWISSPLTEAEVNPMDMPI